MLRVTYQPRRSSNSAAPEPQRVIRAAEPLHFWFERFGLDPTRCEAAVVVSTPTQQKWQERLSAMCAAFEAALVTVDPSVAAHSFAGDA